MSALLDAHDEVRRREVQAPGSAQRVDISELPSVTDDGLGVSKLPPVTDDGLGTVKVSEPPRSVPLEPPPSSTPSRTTAASAVVSSGGASGERIRRRSAVMTPLLLLAVQFRSVLELFCANFVGAPHLPDEISLLQIARTIVTDALVALGVDLQVAAVLMLLHLEPMLKSVLRMYGLPAGDSLRDHVPSVVA